MAGDPSDELEPERPGDDLDATEGETIDDVLDEVGPGHTTPQAEGPGTTPTPDPLKHASAYVDEAKLAEGGAEVPAPDGEEHLDEEGDLQDEDPNEGRGFEDVAGGVELGEDYASAPDELQAPEPTARSAAAAAAQHEHPRRKRGKVLTFFGHCIDELRRVQWPNRQQVGQGTAVTLGFVVIAGSYLGLLDAIWQPVIEAIL